METTEVLVVGAGLAGLRTARALACLGLRVTLTDRKASPAEGVRTTGIFVRRSLEDFAFSPEYLGPPISRVVLWSPAGRSTEVQSRRDEFRIGRMSRLYESELQASVAAGVVWQPRHEFVGVEFLRSSMLAEFATPDGPRLVRTRYLVGADGCRSKVAQRLLLDLNRRWIVAAEDVIDGARLEGPARLHCLIDPRIAPGYIAWVAWDLEGLHVGAGGWPGRFQPDQALRATKETMTQVLRKAGMLSEVGDLSHLAPGERRLGPIPVGGVLPRIVNRRGLLVGDAAGAASPLTAGGLDACLRMAPVAAACVQRFLASGDSEALAQYDGRRFRARFASRRALRRGYDSVASAQAVEALLLGTRLPGGRRATRAVFFGSGSFPDARPGRGVVLPESIRPGSMTTPS